MISVFIEMKAEKINVWDNFKIHHELSISLFYYSSKQHQTINGPHRYAQ